MDDDDAFRFLSRLAEKANRHHSTATAAIQETVPELRELLGAMFETCLPYLDGVLESDIARSLDEEAPGYPDGGEAR